MGNRSYISVSEGVTSCNSLALCGCSPSNFVPIDSPSFTTCIITPVIKITTGAAAGCVLTSGADGTASWTTPSSGGGLAWTGSTNNGIGTYSSSGTICSEPNLTFDGSALAFAVGATRYICFGSAGSDTLCVYGATNNTTKGGDIKIEAGEGFTTTGGSVCIIAGQGDVYGKVSLFQNNVERLATTTTGVLICGNIGLATGAERCICFNQIASGVGSILTIQGNQGAATSAGGVVNIRGGCGGATSGAGGALCLCGGSAGSTGGAVHIVGASTGSAGGTVYICGGGAPTGGHVCIYGGSAGGEVKIYTNGTSGDLIFHACYNGGSGYAGLYYDGSEKLKTVTNGVCVPGTNCGFAVDWIATSDCRLKTDIQPITNALSVVSQLCGISYKLCDDSNNENRIGLIAQDVLPILPEVVSHSAPSEEDMKYGITDDKLGLKYDKLTAVLIEAVKELEQKVQSLILEIERIKTC